MINNFMRIYTAIAVDSKITISLPFTQATIGQIDDYYFKHCGHSRLEVDAVEITTWYRERGWQWVSERA